MILIFDGTSASARDRSPSKFDPAAEIIIRLRIFYPISEGKF
jgi:hypothetical protein